MITQANGWMLAALVDVRAGRIVISAISFPINVSYRSRGVFGLRFRIAMIHLTITTNILIHTFLVLH